MTVRDGETGSNLADNTKRVDNHNNIKTSNRVRHFHHRDREREVIMESAKALSSKKFSGLYTGPYFDPGMPRNITAQMGDTALITCNVNQIGKFQVHGAIYIHTHIYFLRQSSGTRINYLWL